MKKGIRGHDVEAEGLKNISARCLSNGITYLQLVLEKSVDGFKSGGFSESYARSLKEELGDIKIAILGSYINPSAPDDGELKENIGKFKEKIRYASILKPIAVGTETGVYKAGETDTEAAYSRVLGSFRELISEAQKYGVCIAVEGVHCFVINTPQKMKRLVDDLDSDLVRVIFDPVNYINIDNYKEQDRIINDTFDLLGDRICVLHTKDFTVDEDGAFRIVKPAEGMLNYGLILKRMKELKLDIPVICEEISDTEALLAFKRIEEREEL